MSNSRLLVGAGRLLVALAVLLFILTSTALAFMSPALVAYEYGRPGFPPSERFNPQDRLVLAQETVRRMVAERPGEGLRALTHEGQPLYTEREVEHLVDVHVWIDWLRWGWRASAAILLVALLGAVWRQGWRRPLARGAFQGSLFLVGALGAILITALLSWDWFFVAFHQALFAADSWTFAYEDSLIQLYPVEFWMDALRIPLAAILVGALAVGGLAFLYLRRGERQA